MKTSSQNYLILACSCSVSDYNLLANSDSSSSAYISFISVSQAIFKANIVFMASEGYMDDSRCLTLHEADDT